MVSRGLHIFSVLLFVVTTVACGFYRTVPKTINPDKLTVQPQPRKPAEPSVFEEDGQIWMHQPQKVTAPGPTQINKISVSVKEEAGEMEIKCYTSGEKEDVGIVLQDYWSLIIEGFASAIRDLNENIVEMINREAEGYKAK